MDERVRTAIFERLTNEEKLKVLYSKIIQLSQDQSREKQDLLEQVDRARMAIDELLSKNDDSIENDIISSIEERLAQLNDNVEQVSSHIKGLEANGIEIVGEWIPPKGDRGEKGQKGDKGDKGENGIDGVNGLDGKDGSPDSPIDVKKKLESLTGEDRLSINFIKDLPPPVTRIIERVGSKHGGGGGSLIVQNATGTNWQDVKTLIIGSGMAVSRTSDNVMTISATGLINDGDYGDITVSEGGTIWTIDAGLPATRIGGGTVDDTEFSYLNGVTSAIQTQLDGKVDSNTAITGATKTKVTYDSKGLITAGADATTSDISEGSNLYFTDERAQDAIGLMVDSTLTYVDATPSLGINLANANTWSGIQTFDANVNLSGATASTIASFDASKNLVSLTTATYPSLTELSYIKGVTSAVQSQINNKAATSTSITIAGTANQINSSVGAQDLSASRTWTLSLPQDIATSSSPTFSAVNFGGGSASAPSITFTSDGDTGIYNAGTNTLGFATGGSARAVFDSSGRLIIGATSAGSYTGLLMVSGAAASDGSAPITALIKSTTTGSFTSGSDICRIDMGHDDNSGPGLGAKVRFSFFTNGTGGTGGLAVYCTPATGLTKAFEFTENLYFRIGGSNAAAAFAIQAQSTAPDIFSMFGMYPHISTQAEAMGHYSYNTLSWARSGTTITFTVGSTSFLLTGMPLTVASSSDTLALPNGEYTITVASSTTFTITGVSAGGTSGTAILTQIWRRLFPNGNMTVGHSTTNNIARFRVQTESASRVGISIDATASQTGNLLQVRDSSSNVLSYIGPDGNIKTNQAGVGFYIKEGTNACMGSATLVGGTVTVNTTKVTANSRIFLTINANGGTVGTPYVSARTAGTSFTITSTSGADTSTIAWMIVEPT